MKSFFNVSALALGLSLASSVYAGASLHTGGDVYQAPTSAVSEINFAKHYGQLFDQLDTNHDGLLQASEFQNASNIQLVSLTSGGYQRSPITINASNKPLTKSAFIALQNVKATKKAKKMAEQSNPQEWLSDHIGHG